MLRVALALAVLAVLGCTKPADDGLYRGTGLGGLERVPWDGVETDFQRLGQPGTLTFVELSGSHCGGCRKNLKLFERLLRVRHDVSVRIVPFPEELCAPDAPKLGCREVVAMTKQEGMCFTPTLWAIAPDGRLLARDDTCAGTRPASELFHRIADRALGSI